MVDFLSTVWKKRRTSAFCHQARSQHTTFYNNGAPTQFLCWMFQNGEKSKWHEFWVRTV